MPPVGPSRQDQTILSLRSRYISLLPRPLGPLSRRPSPEVPARAFPSAPGASTPPRHKESPAVLPSCPRLSFLGHHFLQYCQCPLAPSAVDIAMSHHAHRIHRGILGPHTLRVYRVAQFHCCHSGSRAVENHDVRPDLLRIN